MIGASFQFTLMDPDEIMKFGGNDFILLVVLGAKTASFHYGYNHLMVSFGLGKLLYLDWVSCCFLTYFSCIGCLQVLLHYIYWDTLPDIGELVGSS